MSGRKKHLSRKIPFFLLVIITLLSFRIYAQVPDFVVNNKVWIRADQGEAKMSKDVGTVDVQVAGHYRIYAHAFYNSGDEQVNESFYMLVRQPDGTISTPVDSNAGPYKIVPDDPGPRHGATRDAGLFYFPAGQNTIELHHYFKIAHQYPYFVNSSAGDPESVRIDSLRIVYEPFANGAVNIRAYPTGTLQTDDQTFGLVYPDQTFQFDLIVKNLERDVMYHAGLKTLLPQYISLENTSLPPDQQNNGEILWQLPDMAENDSLTITVTARVSASAPSGYTPATLQAFLSVFNDRDLSDNYDAETVYIYQQPSQPLLGLADLDIKILSQTDSILVIQNDTTKYARPGDIIRYTLRIVNRGPDTAKAIRLLNVLPVFVRGDQFSIVPVGVDSNIISWQFAELAPGEQIEISFHGIVDSTLTVDRLPLIDNAFVSTDSDTLLNNNLAADTVLTAFEQPARPRKVDLAIEYVAITDATVLIGGRSEQAVQMGKSYQYNMRIRNNGPVTAKDVRVWNSLPDSVSLSNFSPDTSYHWQQMLFWRFDSLYAGQQIDIYFDATVADSLPQTPFKLYSESGVYTQLDSFTTNNNDSAIVYAISDTGTTKPKLVDVAVQQRALTDSMAVVGNDTLKYVRQGDVYTIRITVKNDSANNAENVTIVDVLPDSVTASAIDPPPTRTTNDSLIWVFPVLQGNLSTTLQFQAAVAPQIAYESFLFINKVTVSADNESPEGLTNNTSVDTVRLAQRPPAPIADTDLSFSLEAQTDTSITIDGKEEKAVLLGDDFAYNLTVKNQGQATAYQVSLWQTVPDSVSASDFTIEPIRQSGDTLFWTFDSLDKSAQVAISFRAQVADSIPMVPFKLLSLGMLTALNDNSPANNADTSIVYAIFDSTKIPPSLADVSVKQRAVTDSFAVVSGDTIKFARRGETYLIRIIVKNDSAVYAKDINVADFIPDSVTISGADPIPFSLENGRIEWHIATIPPHSVLILQFYATVSPNMPVGTNLLINRVTVSAGNEDPNTSFNNTSIDTVYNYVSPPKPFTPEIEAMPPIVDVGDSIYVRVRVPQQVASYDLWLYLPDGRIDSTFADDFIRTHELLPGEWLDIFPGYAQEHLLTSARQEQVRFEIRTRDFYGRFSSAIAEAIIQSGNYLVLDRNVFEANGAEPLGIKVKLSSRRTASLDVYDISGRHIDKLVERVFPGGWTVFYWNGMTRDGQKVGSGVYIVTLHSGEYNDWKKFILVR